MPYITKYNRISIKLVILEFKYVKNREFYLGTETLEIKKWNKMLWNINFIIQLNNRRYILLCLIQFWILSSLVLMIL
jgi:hypothetical protein